MARNRNRSQPKLAKAKTEVPPSAVSQPTAETTEAEIETSKRKSSTLEWWNFFLAIAAVLVALASAIFTVIQMRETRRINRAHVKPRVELLVRRDTQPQYSNSPYASEFVVINHGPIKAVSVYAKWGVSVIDTNTLTVSMWMSIAEDLRDYSFLIPELQVGEARAKSIIDVSPMAVFRGEVSYFRENDMQKFTDSILFVYESGQFSDHATFRKRKDYELIMQNLDSGTNQSSATKVLPTSTPNFEISVPKDGEPRVLRSGSGPNGESRIQ